MMHDVLLVLGCAIASFGGATLACMRHRWPARMRLHTQDVYDALHRGSE